MFNGLIREIGEVIAFTPPILKIKSRLKAGLGDSIAVNGACLSVVKVHVDGFEVQVSEETLRYIADENLYGKVHLEPAMRLGDRIDGHLLQGHIDGIGVIKKIQPQTTGVDFWVEAPASISHLIVPKGSIGIDGVSLTVNEVDNVNFRLTLIPITFRESNFCQYQVGRKLNIETDMITRSIAHLLQHRQNQASHWNWDELDQITLNY